MKGFQQAWNDRKWRSWGESPWSFRSGSAVTGSGATVREGSDFIPDKCFLPFRDHGLARVQPQTQCTINRAAREERWEGKKKGKKKHLEFKIQITVSIKETGTRENTFKRQSENQMGLAHSCLSWGKLQRSEVTPRWWMLGASADLSWDITPSFGDIYLSNVHLSWCCWVGMMSPENAWIPTLWTWGDSGCLPLLSKAQGPKPALKRSEAQILSSHKYHLNLHSQL